MTAIPPGEKVITVLLLIGIAIFATLLFELVRLYFANKRREIAYAAEALDRHFDAVDLIVSDSAVHDLVKRILVRFSAMISDRDTAEAVACSIIQNTKLELSPEKKRAVSLFFAEHRRLMKLSRLDLANAMMTAIEFGFVSMILRWPQAEIALPNLALLDAESQDGYLNIREKASRVIEQMPQLIFSGSDRSSELWESTKIAPTG